MFVRKNKKTGKSEIVLLDHGLYEFLPESTRISLCQFWEAIVLKDKSKMQKFAEEMNVKGVLHEQPFQWLILIVFFAHP